MIDSKNVGIFLMVPLLPAMVAYVEDTSVELITKHLVDINENDVRRIMSGFSDFAKIVFRSWTYRVDNLNRDSILELFRAGALSCPTKAFSVHTMMLSTAFNASCQPNICLHIYTSPGPLICAETCRKILPGEELCFAEHYSFACMTTDERQETMVEASIYPHRCACRLCAQPAAERLASDMRRCLMRNLWLMLKGHDLPNVKPKVTISEKDKVGSPQWHLHRRLFDKLAEVEGVSWMIEDLEKMDRSGARGPVVLRQTLVEW
jgi:hypothetical protein